MGKTQFVFKSLGVIKKKSIQTTAISPAPITNRVAAVATVPIVDNDNEDFNVEDSGVDCENDCEEKELEERILREQQENKEDEISNTTNITEQGTANITESAINSNIDSTFNPGWCSHQPYLGASEESQQQFKNVRKEEVPSPTKTCGAGEECSTY